MVKEIEASAEEVGKQFGHFSDLALQAPVIVTRYGRPRTVLISAGEYERLKRRDRQVLDFAVLDEAKRQELITALEAPVPARRPDLDAELDGWKP
jgi:PHD/YefM family antitoxin component YafN of YafNO toxin-antitoxin module